MVRRSIKSWKKKRRSNVWKSKKSRKYGKKRKARVDRTLTNNIGLGYTKVARLCYVDTFKFTPGTASPFTRSFQVNNLYDTDPVVAYGHQPFGRDLYASIFKIYRVKKVVVYATVYNNRATEHPVKFSLMLDRDNAIDGALNSRIEQVHGKNIKTILTNSRERGHCKITYTPETFFDLVDAKDSHQMQADINGAPTLPAYCVFWAQVADYNTAHAPVDSMTVDFRLEFTVEFSEPGIQPAS